MITNRTPHSVVLYPLDTPDAIVPGSVQPLHSWEPPDPAVRIITEDAPGVAEPEPGMLAGRMLISRDLAWLPPYQPAAGPVRGPEDDWSIVSLASAAAAPPRDDLLVTHREVRALITGDDGQPVTGPDGRPRVGAVIGCRALVQAVRLPAPVLARPVRPEPGDTVIECAVEALGEDSTVDLTVEQLAAIVYAVRCADWQRAIDEAAFAAAILRAPADA